MPVERSLSILLGDTSNLLHTFVLWLFLQSILVLPVYVLVMFQPLWTTVKRMNILVSDLVIATGIIICLRVDPVGFAKQLTDTSGLTNIGLMSTIILGIWLIIILMDILNQVRKLHNGLRKTT